MSRYIKRLALLAILLGGFCGAGVRAQEDVPLVADLSSHLVGDGAKHDL